MWDDTREPIDVRGFDDEERRVIEHVEQFGTHVVQVDGDEQDDGFSYTIGLQYHHDHPELIVFGQKPDWRHWLLNAMRDEILGGARFEPGKRYAGVMEHFRLAITAIPGPMLREYFGWALWFYRDVAPGDVPLDAVQVVWPDLHDMLPWEAGYRAGYRQPILEGTPAPAPANRFPIGLESGVFACDRVMRGEAVLRVVRKPADDGRTNDDWQFLCGGLHDEAAGADGRDGAQFVHLRRVLERDEALNALADLPVGSVAERATKSAPWVRSAENEAGV